MFKKCSEENANIFIKDTNVNCIKKGIIVVKHSHSSDLGIFINKTIRYKKVKYKQ